MAKSSVQSRVSSIAKEKLDKENQIRAEEQKQRQAKYRPDVNSQQAYNSIMAEVTKRRNAAANIRQVGREATSRMLTGEYNPVANRLKQGIYTDIQKNLNGRIENELHIINDQGREKNDPAVLRAKETLTDLYAKNADNEEKLRGINRPVFSGSRANPNEPRLTYSPEENEYIRRLRERGNGQIENIPLVYNDRAKQMIHTRDAAQVVDEDTYVQWLMQAANAGMMKPEEEANARRYAFYHGMPDAANSREYSDYLRRGIESGMFDNDGDLSMMSTGKLQSDLADFKRRKAQAEHNSKNSDEINDELYNTTLNKDVFEELQVKGFYDPLTQTYHHGRPEDYEEWGERGQGGSQQLSSYYDSILYDSIHGEGAYSRIMQEGTNEEYDRMDAEVQDLWDRLENGTIGQLGDQYNDRISELQGAAYGGESNLDREIRRRQEELTRRQTIGQYAGMEGAAYDPSLIDPETEAKYRTELIRLGDEGTAPTGNKTEWLYWIINNISDKEHDYGGGFLGELTGVQAAEQGYRKYSFMTDEMIGQFNALYEAGKVKEAQAFMDAIDPYITQLASGRAEELRYNASKGDFGGLYGAMTILRQPIAGLSGTMGSLAALLGNEDAKNPNSGWYKWQKMNNTTRGARAEAWGDFFADKFGEQYRGAGEWLNGVTYSVADNLMAMAIARAGGSVFNYDMSSKAAERMIQFVMSSSAASSSMVDKISQGMDPTEAALYAVGNGMIEAITEKYSIEALLQPNIKDMLGDWKKVGKFLLKNTIAEGTEEGASDVLNTVWDEVLSGIYGHESELSAQYNELIAQGMSPKDATRQVLRGWLANTGSDMLAGALSGFVMSGGRTAMNTVNQQKAGTKIRSKGNTTAGKTGVEQLIEAARGMDESTESRRMAEELNEKVQSGKKVSSGEAGRLAQNILYETNETMGNIARGTVERMVRDTMKENGATPEQIERTAGIVTDAVVKNKKLTKGEMSTVAEVKQAIEAYRDLMTNEGKMVTGMAVRMNPEGSVTRSVRETVGRLLNGESAEKVDHRISRDIMQGVQGMVLANDEDLANVQKGKRSKTGTDAIVDNEIVQLTGKEGDSYIVKTADGTEKKVSAAAVTAVDTMAGAIMAYTEGNGRTVLGDEAFGTIAKGAQENKKMAPAKYIAEAMKVYMAARTGGQMPGTTLAESTAQAIWNAAQNENRQATRDRQAAGQLKVEAGKGTASFDGAEYGTDAWKEKIKGLSKQIRNQMGAVAEYARRIGLHVDFINDTENEAIFGSEDRSTGRITINVAGKEADYTKDGKTVIGGNHHLLVVAAHEFTHWLEQNSTESYDELRQFIFDKIRSRGQSVEALVMNKIDAYRSVAKQDLSIEDAMAEIVADACDQVLGSEKVAREIEQSKPNLFKKIKQFVTNLVDFIHEVAAGMESSASAEARLLQDWADELEERWLNTLKEAQGREQAPAEAEKGEEGAQYSVQDIADDQKKYEGKELYADSSVYDYDFLTSLHPILEIQEGNIKEVEKEEGDIDERKLADIGMKNAIDEAGGKASGNAVLVTNEYTGRKLVITRKGIGHSVHTESKSTNRANARIAQKVGLLAKHAVPINALKDEADVKGTYAMAAPVLGEDGKMEKVAILTIEVRTGNLVDIDVYDQVHAVSGRKKNEARKTRGARPNGPTANTHSFRISISDLIEEINSTHRGILSQNVLDHYKEERPMNGYWGPRAKFSLRELSEQDQAYADAVERGDIQTATDMLMDKLAHSENIIPFNAPEWYAGEHMDVAKMIKQLNSDAVPEEILSAAEKMASYVPDNGVLVPMPNHHGEVNEDTDTMILARVISEMTGRPVVAALAGADRESRFKSKENGGKGIQAEEMGFRQVEELPEGTIPIFIDNVVGSGVTAQAARQALGGGITLAYAKSVRSKGIEGLKRATITYDKNGKLIPLSERFNPNVRDIRFSMQATVEQNADGLVALHNLGEEQLMKVFRLGGFAMPSIAVIRAAMGHTAYGDISVLFSKDTIDPRASRYNKVYGGDAWTPTYPSIEYKLNSKKLDKIMQKIRDMLPERLNGMSVNLVDLYEQNLGQNINSQKGEPNIAKAIGSEAKKWLRIAYMENTGKEIKYPSKQKDLDAHRSFDNDQVIHIANILGRDIAEEAMKEGDPWHWANQHPEIVEQIRTELNNKWRESLPEDSRLRRLDLYNEQNYSAASAEYMLRAINKYYNSGLSETVDVDALDKTLKETIDEEDFNKWVNNLFSGVIEKSGIRNNKEYYTNSGNPRSWEQLHDEETLDNVVRIMRDQEDKGENAFFVQSAIMARGTKDFKSIDEIRKNKEQLQELSEEEYSELRQNIGAQFTELMDELYDRKERKMFIARDRVIDAIADAVNTSNKTAANISRTMKEWGYNLTQEQAQRIADLMEQISNLPTKYFEAKPKRAVTLDEIKRVILPATASQELFDAMDERGIPYDTYDGTDEDRLAKLNSVKDVQFSIRQGDMEINRWMQGLTASSLQTEQERTMLKQWQETMGSLNMARHALFQYRTELSKLEAKPAPTAYEKHQMSVLRSRVETWQKKVDRHETELAKATSEKGFAAIMRKQSRIMTDLVNGRTADEVRGTVDAINAELETVQKEMEERSERLKQLAKKEAVIRIRQQLNSAGLKRIAAKLKSDLNSELSSTEIENRLALMALKMKEGKIDETDVTELADMLIGKMRRTYDSYILDELRGRTITLSKSQQAELKGQNRTIREIRQELAGTGIRIDTKGGNTLDKNWSELCDLIPALDKEAADKDMLDQLLNVITAEKDAARNQYTAGMDMEVASMVIDAASNLVPEIVTDKKSMQLIRETLNFIAEMSTEAEESARAMEELNSLMARLQKKGGEAKSTLGRLESNIQDAIAYNNELSLQSEQANWLTERHKLIDQLKSEHTQEMLRQQAEYRLKIEKDKAARGLMNENMALRRRIHTNISRIQNLLMKESVKQNIPEHMKGLAREMLGLIVRNDMTGRKITGLDLKMLQETQRVLDAWLKQDGKYNPDELKGLDEAVQDAIHNALEGIRAGIDFYNASTKGSELQVNLQAFKNALTRISEGVSTITGAINAERSIALGDRRVAVEDQACKVQESTGGRRAKELTGSLGRTISALQRAITTGNLTPEYFFKMLKNAGLDDLWEEYHRAENRNGLELAKAKARLDEIAKKYGFKEWDTDARQAVKLGSGTVNMTLGQIMSLYATWKREHTLGPAMSQHLQNGGFYVEEYDPRKGILGRREVDLKAHRVTEADMEMVNGLLTDAQKQFIDDIVGFMSGDMSELGNEASMKAYGIRMYKESYYFPFKMWDGIKAMASNDSGSAAAANDRAFHPSFSKTRMHGANNALILGDFMTTAADHIVGMINYATMGLANENLQKMLNTQVPEGERLDQMTRRTIRTVLEEAYGKKITEYLAKLQEQLNGGAVRVDRTIYDRMLTLFRKNAVAGSLSVALQQPVSYIRAAMMINPKYLAEALSPAFWKGSYAEMMAHSGVAVIKKMGRFDMGFGAGAREYITPDGKEGKIRKAWDEITDKATILPELADQMMWTRMWSAVKLEQHALYPDMDVKSDAFLDMVGERFNDLMRKTQVYDSTLTKSQNMRSQNPFVKSITSFMAEPTLTLNVLADAAQNVKEKGGKLKLMKALATFALSAMAQAAAKALTSTGRSPDDKKTWEENFWYRYVANMINEGDVLNLIPGYNDLITLLKDGKLEDDAMGVIGKLFTAGEKLLSTTGNPGDYRTWEDGVGQIVQLFTQLPAKNLMRDLRAMYNWFIGKPYADRPTSAAVIRLQAKASMMTADNLIGVISAKLGEAGYKVTNSAYYDRMYSAIQEGNKQEADAIREYLTLGKGVKEETIDSNMRTMTRNGNLFPALEANKAAEIAEAIKELQGFGAEVKDIKSSITKEMKPKYLEADAAGRVKIRDAIQKAYKAMGLTAADADKVINGWKKEE